MHKCDIFEKFANVFKFNIEIFAFWSTFAQLRRTYRKAETKTNFLQFKIHIFFRKRTVKYADTTLTKFDPTFIVEAVLPFVNEISISY